jgi:uncharacterized membrane protein (DUF485 family)
MPAVIVSMIAEIIRVLLSLAAAFFGFISVAGWVFHFSAGPTHGAGIELGIIGGLCAVVLAIVVLRWSARDDRRHRSTPNDARR